MSILASPYPATTQIIPPPQISTQLPCRDQNLKWCGSNLGFKLGTSATSKLGLTRSFRSDLFCWDKMDIFRASRVSNLLERMKSVGQVSCRLPRGGLSDGILWLAGTNTGCGWPVCLGRFDEYR